MSSGQSAAIPAGLTIPGEDRQRRSVRFMLSALSVFLFGMSRAGKRMQMHPHKVHVGGRVPHHGPGKSKGRVLQQIRARQARDS